MQYGRQYLDEDDIQAVVETLQGDWLTQGPSIEEFEKAICDFTGAKYAVVFSSGTAALHGAAAAADLGPGDLLVSSALTFFASVNCARYVGAHAGVVDISPETWNIDLSLVPTEATAVVPVHYGGLPVDLRNAPWRQRPKYVIEDASHALGALTPEGPVGNCAHSDMCCFSFHPVKPITTGEGGAVTTNSPDLARRLRTFRSHGITRYPEVEPWLYYVEELGFNYRLSDIQAALGLSQIRKIETFTAKRNHIANHYRRLFASKEVGLPPSPEEGFRHSYHLFPVLVDHRREVFETLRSHRIGVQVHYVPVHFHPAWKSFGSSLSSLETTELVYSKVLSLPMHVGVSEQDVELVSTLLQSES
jgi:perosamine synthetase